MRALVLLGGGIDSAACVAFYRSLDLSEQALIVDYGQRTSVREFETVAGGVDAYHYIQSLQQRDV